MTPAELAVLGDMLRAVKCDGEALPEATVQRMLRAVDGEFERLAASWAKQMPARPWTDHACVECVPDWPDDYPMRSKTGWMCFYHRAMALNAPTEQRGGLTVREEPICTCRNPEQHLALARLGGSETIDPRLCEGRFPGAGAG